MRMKAIIIIVVLVAVILIVLMTMNRSRSGRYHRRNGHKHHLRSDFASDSESSDSNYSSDSSSDFSESRSSSDSASKSRSSRRGCCKPIYIVPVFNPGINGVNIQLQVTGGTRPFTYKWSTGETTSNLVNVPYFTNLFVKIYDANRCEGELEFNAPGAPDGGSTCPEITPSIQKLRLNPKNY